MCTHAKFITFGRTGGIGCVPMQNLLLLAEPEVLGVALAAILRHSGLAGTAASCGTPAADPPPSPRPNCPGVHLVEKEKRQPAQRWQ